jgi:hypothetical protein
MSDYYSDTDRVVMGLGYIRESIDENKSVLSEIRDAICEQVAVGRECVELMRSAKAVEKKPDPESIPSVDYLGIHADLNAEKEVLLYNDRLMHFLLECSQRGVELRVQLTMNNGKAVLKRIKP